MTAGVSAIGTAALQAMRTALRPYHDSIEQSLDLMRADVDRSHYVRFLEKSYGFVAACEQRLDIGAAPPSLAIDRRLKGPLLRTNLRALGCGADAIDRLAWCEQLPHVEHWPAALGYFYVIEGSTLGGQLLARHCRERLAVGDEALAFLLGYRHDTGMMWKRMVGVLEAAMCDEAAAEAITASARQTFTLLERWHRSG
jgi:heme oxygenase